MKTAMKCLICGVVVCGLAVPAARAEDKVDSPIYKHWAKFKPGAFCVAKTVRTAKGIKAEITATTTLKEVSPERVVVELQIATVGSDEKIEMLPRKQAYPAKIEKDEARKMEDPKKGDTVENWEILDVQQGEEEIKVGDKKIKCKWVETKSKKEDQTSLTKSWTSDEIPGQLVKMTQSVDGPVKMTSECMLAKYSLDGSSDADKAEKKDQAEPPTKAAGDKDKGEKKTAGDKKEQPEKKEQVEKKEQKEKK